MMKRILCILALFMLASPLWAAKKLTVQQLNDLLVSFQNGKKTDVEAATELKQVELTEEQECLLEWLLAHGIRHVRLAD